MINSRETTIGLNGRLHVESMRWMESESPPSLCTFTNLNEQQKRRQRSCAGSKSKMVRTKSNRSKAFPCLMVRRQTS